MRTFFLLVKLRLLDVIRRPVAGFFILILPVVFLLIIGGMFANGHPFERRRVSMVSMEGAPEQASLSGALHELPGIRVVPERTDAAIAACEATAGRSS